MDLAFFGAYQEYVGVEGREVEAQSTGQSDQGSFIVIVLAGQFQADDLFRLDLVLHKHPVHDPTIRGDGVEVELLGDVRVPGHLPDRVGVFLGTDGGLVNRSFVLVPDVIDQNSAIIQPYGQQGRGGGMEI